MNTQEMLSELGRAMRDIVRIGIVAEVDTVRGLCRIQTGEILTDWLHWLTARAGRTLTWWAPSVGEQVLLFSLGGELDTGFVLPGIYSDDFPAPSLSAETYHISFPDGAQFQYEPVRSALKVSGIQTAEVAATKSIQATAPNVTVTASSKITLDTPEVVCTNKLTTGSLEVQKGGAMTGDIIHAGGAFTSNGVQVDAHTHGGVQNGGGNTSKPN